MQSEHGAGSRLEVHLPNGNRVNVAVEVDGDGSADAELAVATAVILSGDVESEIEDAVAEVGVELGLSVERPAMGDTSRIRTIVVRSP